ncbi:GNAT family N-acetyltransferase [Pandoraea terrigena]|uniref:Acetyl CoA--N6-hydroxylysine acetyl transferase n=1 Tax=Pandoraea terrigena TaxID=2508292 RepID=A0A5E4UST6_9BURK|nr:GNAT family N-acetyltransferase [Pandoraea terrigena]VVE03061.1 acetyl CoA--N6-hydroxylysine acetyl transferase [Pandoraea terrigena]
MSIATPAHIEPSLVDTRPWAAAHDALYALSSGDGRRYYACGPDDAVARAEQDLTLWCDGRAVAIFHVTEQDAAMTLQARTRHDAGLPVQALLPLLAAVFCRHKACGRATIVWPDALAGSDFAAWRVAAVRDGVGEALMETEGARGLHVSRQTFWQHPAMWLRGPSSAGMAQQYRVSDGKRHPLRAPKPVGEVYRRHIARLGTSFSLRSIDQSGDLERFHEWMNLDSVAHFWEQTGTIEAHADYLAKMQADPHAVTLFGCFDDEPFAYFEVYWAKEDRIAPFCDAADYDRGFHLLVGSTRFRSPGRTEAWLRSIVHYLFLDDPRTQRIVGEPRIDHDRWIAYMQGQGAARLREFDFPHKRAVLIAFERQTIFEQYAPW